MLGQLLRARGLSVAFSLIFLPLTTAFTAASSQLDFPRLSLEEDTFNGIALFNPTAAEARVTFTAYGLSGEVLGVTQLVIPAGGQVAQLASELFPLLRQGDDGWIQASSSTRGLTGFFLFLDRGLREFDGAELPVRSRSLVFNDVRAGSGFSTELNVVNPGTEPRSLTLTLSAPQLKRSSSAELAPKAALRVDVAEFFEIDALTAGATVTTEGDGELVGFELVRFEGADLAGLNARSLGERLNTLYFPQVAVLGPIRSQLGLVNHSDQPITAWVTIHRPDGSLFLAEVDQNPVSIAVEAGGNRLLDLARLFGFAGSEAMQGWLEVTTSQPSMQGYLSYRVEPTGAAASVASGTQGLTRGIFSHLATTRGFFTGVAALNPGRLAADVRFVAQARSGQRLGVFDTVLPPRSRLSRLITELIPAAAGQDGGLIWVSSTQPIFLTSLFGTNQGSVLANIPPQTVPAAFRPDSGVARARVSPELAVLGPSDEQPFEVAGTSGAPEWSVDGILGGTLLAGLIGSDGVYQAPPAVPSLPVVVTAREEAEIASATVDVLQQQVLIPERLSAVTAMAFLPQRNRLVLARSSGDDGSSAEIVELQPSLQISPLVSLASERVSGLLPMEIAGREYLLATGSVSGRLLRIDPQAKTIRTIVTGLASPRSLQLDPLTGGLFVAEQGRFSLLPRVSLERSVAGSEEVPLSSGALIGKVRLDEDVVGLTVDRCSGELYFTLSSGDLLLRSRRSEGESESVLAALRGAASLVALYRQGVACPRATHLLLAEAAADRLTLHVPSRSRRISPWTHGGAGLLSFLPSGNPYREGAALLVLDEGTAAGQLRAVDLQDLYGERPPNPPINRLKSEAGPPGPDLFFSNVSAQPGGLAAVTLAYRAGPGGADALTTLAFTVRYDPVRLSLATRDADADGVPDAIQSTLPAEFELLALPQVDPGRLDLVLVDFERPFSALPEGDLLTFHFRVLQPDPGSFDVSFGSRPMPSAANSQGQVRRLDETRAGTIFVLP